MKLRTRLSKFELKKLLAVKELAMSVLVLIGFVLLALEHIEKLSVDQLYAAEAFDVLVGCIFLAEFFVELHFAKDKRRYWRQHWLFLLASIPLPFQTVQILRGIRLVRLLRLFDLVTHWDYEHNTKLVR